MGYGYLLVCRATRTGGEGIRSSLSALKSGKCLRWGEEGREGGTGEGV